MDERPLTPDDAERGLALSREAGWNQTAADWRMILTAGRGRGIVDNGRLVATAAVLPYGARLGWICMVLVTASARRQGLATRLMRWAIDTLAAEGRTAGLDATSAGRAVYARLGFRDAMTLTRHAATAPSFAEGVRARPMTAGDVAAALRLDERVFGADRGAVLRSLAGRALELSAISGERPALRGFALGRRGDRCTHIGPVIADSVETAEVLLRQVLEHHKTEVLIDVPDSHPDLSGRLRDAGFAPQREFTRMLNGPGDAPLDPSRTFAVAGPELS